ncbi:MAG: alpha-xylosidase, partial [Muribaculum sp.]|nr:alpha-xylosidase [Muribaculum sp.]
TLDGFNGNLDLGGNPMKLEKGLLATDGWTLVDDSSSLLFDPSQDWTWVKERKSKKGAQDWYFMAYGHDYKQALKDFTLFAGDVPLPPRYAFGFWWSRFWSYTDNEIRDLVNRFKTYDIPLDVLVIDMDWHFTEPGKGGWTGYTWNTDIFPEPAEMLKFIKDNNLQITMNLHPAEGVKNYEEKYDALKAYLGLPAADTTDIPFEASNPKFMKGWLDVVLHPMQKDGVDFCWLHLQKCTYDKKIPSLSNTWWLNYTFFSDMERNGDLRPILYHRWGGLGNHRYQIGFSGDTFTTWETLDYQPYFNNTASNVLYGYWSHDIGGHLPTDGDFKMDPEMYIRWLQYGAFSPILRVHSTKDTRLKKEPWNYEPRYAEIMRNTIRNRYDMAPYIYTMGRKTHETGLSICRPMYYDYPEAAEAYDMKNEYMFGDQMLVLPITAPMNGPLGTAK